MFYDASFPFTDGEVGKKLFVVLGSMNSVYVVAKTTSRGKAFSKNAGCQPTDRFHNYHLPDKCCDLDRATWVCLDELYELKQNEVLQKGFAGEIRPVCDLPSEFAKAIQECALAGEDITSFQERVIRQSAV